MSNNPRKQNERVDEIALAQGNVQTAVRSMMTAGESLQTQPLVVVEEAKDPWGSAAPYFRLRDAFVLDTRKPRK